MAIVRFALFAFGYPISIFVIIRFVPVVRERRLRSIIWHQCAVGAIITGFALGEQWSAVAINSTWFGIAAIWYARGGRRDPPGSPAA